MGLEMREPAILPDTFGLPEYRVTKIIKQRVGDEIHFLCGHESFGQTHWTHITIMKVDFVAVESRECEVMALEAIREAGGVVRAHRH